MDDGDQLTAISKLFLKIISYILIFTIINHVSKSKFWKCSTPLKIIYWKCSTASILFNASIQPTFMVDAFDILKNII